LKEGRRREEEVDGEIGRRHWKRETWRSSEGPIRTPVKWGTINVEQDGAVKKLQEQTGIRCKEQTGIRFEEQIGSVNRVANTSSTFVDAERGAEYDDTFMKTTKVGNAEKEKVFEVLDRYNQSAISILSAIEKRRSSAASLGRNLLQRSSAQAAAAATLASAAAAAATTLASAATAAVGATSAKDFNAAATLASAATAAVAATSAADFDAAGAAAATFDRERNGQSTTMLDAAKLNAIARQNFQCQQLRLMQREWNRNQWRPHVGPIRFLDEKG